MIKIPIKQFDEQLEVFWEIPFHAFEFEIEWTKSTLFLLPLIGIDLNKRKDIVPYLNNCFLRDMEYEIDNNRLLYILLETDNYNDTTFKSICNLFRNNSNYILEYDVGFQKNKHLVMMVLQIPDKFVSDLMKFKKGKYSLFSNDAKQLYNQTIINKNNTYIKNLAYHASFKTNDLIEQIKVRFELSNEDVSEMEEIWGLPNKEVEYYRYKLNIL